MNTFGKWLFALLILANVGLWLWMTGFRQGDSAVVEGSRPAIQPEKLRLLTEPGVQVKERAPDAPATPALANAAAGCYRLGPFADDAATEKAIGMLKQIPLAYERKQEEQPVVTGYRVYLPPLASRDAVEKKRRQLTRLGFKDHSLIQEEGLQNAISLGTFTVEANAQKHQRALAAKKIEAKIQTLTQTRTRQWLALGPAENLAGALPRLREADWGSVDAKIEETPCLTGGN
ncbi:MAG: SPOR domain-containing protein [Gammaproteobacteria bacterium]|nr:MAG: SPOR domain-containing protein [Gammaproteobacteria bacterium]